MNSYNIDGITVLPPIKVEYALDPVLSIKHDLVPFEQGYSYEYHNALKNTRDYSFNKHSNFYLSDNVLYNDILEIQAVPEQYPFELTSFLAFNRLCSDPLSALSANTDCLTSAEASATLSADDTVTQYITISNEAGDFGGVGDASVTRRVNAELFTDVKTQNTLQQKYYFNIVFVDGRDCYIYHETGKDRWYLSHKDEPDASLQFVKVEHEYGMEQVTSQVVVDGGDEILFRYTYYKQDNLLRLYKKYNGMTHIVRLLSDEEKDASPAAPPVRLQLLNSPDLDGDSDTMAPNALELTDDTTIRLRPVVEEMSQSMLNSKIVNYNKSLDQNSITTDPANTYKDLQNNVVLHSEYYFLTGETLPINLFPVKNYQDATGITSPTNPWPDQNKYLHRKYNKLFTGTNQIKGTDKIYLDYLTSTAPIKFKPGLNYFNYPPAPEPVKRLNINDAQLIESGALAGDQPSRSDKIFKKRGNYKQTTRWGEPSDAQTGTWLCTWLSGGDDPSSPPVWMDRYYVPGTADGVHLLTTKTDKLHSVFESDTDAIFVSTGNDVYDEPSKMTFEPGASYAYYRLTTKDVDNNLSSLDPFHIQNSFNEYTTINRQPVQSIDGSFVFDGNKYAVASDLKNSSPTGEFSISFNINLLNYKKCAGHQLIGNFTNNGIGIFNKNDVSPFIFIASSDGTRTEGSKQDSSVRIYDTNYNLYNYITNDSFLKTDDGVDTPGLFKHIIIRDLPDNIYFVMSNGMIVEATHDGVVVATYTDWINHFTGDENIADIAYDEQDIYILTHTGTTSKDYIIHTFNMVTKQFDEYENASCIVPIPLPDEIVNNDNYTVGRAFPDGPPNLIYVKDDHGQYRDRRALYLATADDVKPGNHCLWFFIEGANDPVTGLKQKHDMLYGYDTKTLTPIQGKLMDNRLEIDDNFLTITDYCIDRSGNIWIAHSSNMLSKFSADRTLLYSNVLEDQQIMSMVLTRDLEAGEILERLIVLGKTSDGQELAVQIGPHLHPSNDRNSTAWRKASPWIQDGTFYDRTTLDNTDPEDPQIIDAIVYPLSVGSSRFGKHTQDIYSIPATDPTGRVLDGDYTLITEGFDIFVEEVQDVFFGNVFDTSTGELVEAKTLPDFGIDDVNIKPQLHTQYGYGKENFNHYSTHNLNLKLLLEPLFAQELPELVNLKLDLDTLNASAPYTGEHQITINISNKLGRVEFWVDGDLDETRVYEFVPNKYRFNNISSKDITCGCTPYLSNTVLANKLKRPESYVVNDMTISNFNCYSRTLTYHDQLNLLRTSIESIDPMHWNVPSGLRNHIEGVDRLFNHSIPPAKSNTYDLRIRNSAIESLDLQQYITSKIVSKLTKIAPGGTELRNINWTNELFET